MALLLLRWGVFVSNITKKNKKDQTIITNKLTDGEQINTSAPKIAAFHIYDIPFTLIILKSGSLVYP